MHSYSMCVCVCVCARERACKSDPVSYTSTQIHTYVHAATIHYISTYVVTISKFSLSLFL